MKASELITSMATLIGLYGDQPIVVAVESEITAEGGDLEGDCKSICCEFDQNGKLKQFVIYGEG